MSVMQRLRAYHTLLALLVVVAYASGDVEPLHNWLGYAVALVFVARLLGAATGVPQLGLMRFYPKFEGLKLGTAMTHPAISRTLILGIAVCLVGTTATGIAMDRGSTLGMSGLSTAVEVTHNSIEQGTKLVKVEMRPEHHEENDNESLMSEVHELLANLLIAFVGLHVCYLLLFKRPLARFMLFLEKPKA